MLLSHVEPLRPLPKIQTILVGSTGAAAGTTFLILARWIVVRKRR